ncbi:Dauer or Aging adult Overexpression [Caenorhabditis elegans]|uniref:Dauer or Aging adult Overexpression n=1 Tax=Caenorhabditis elegans TaxID=6239 RepID=Q8MPY0_CAEEL|nr:Dauer or Aging adult Overexpression [Caenorhabditis elegans]CAD44154.1 Dauer or Aging adult Overexpression [Caenorhabditis elegans]|eukprot:NP_741265.1 Dauer or Aging adult Overexpression [Caenorhabditis elegans]
MWKKSQFTAYKKVESDEQDSEKQNTFNYQKLSESETMPVHQKTRKGSNHSNASTASTCSTTSSSKRYTSSQQSFAFVPPVFPVVPQKFVFFG